LKRVLSLILVMVLALGCIGFVACGSAEDKEEEETAAEAEEEEAVAEEEEEEESSAVSNGDGISWNDMPIYSGAKQIVKGAWMIPPAEGDWSKVEWRYYESGDTADDITDFYRSKMPDIGWQETMWMDAGEMSWAFYQKNDEQDGAMIWITADNGDSVIALMRATQ